MNELAELEKLKGEMERDASLPLQEANLVFGEGSPESEVMFIGEAPGFYEDRERRPFVGQAGQLLNRLIAENGWRREDVYITNVVKRRPPNNRDPLPEEIDVYKPYLKEQIRIINPKVIVPLGRFSMNYFLPEAKISRDQGKVFWLKDKLIMPIYHPAAALRSSSVMGELQASFQKLKQVVERYNEFAAEKSQEQEKEEKVQQLF